MPGIFYPRHVLRLAAVLERFDGGATLLADAVEFAVIPRNARLERNDVHTADTLAATIDYREFPFDPRLVRALSVAYFAGTTTGGPLPLDAQHLRFLGVVDTPESDLGEESCTVSLEARDYTAILLGQRAKPSMAVPLGRPLDAVLADLLATLPGEQATLLRPVIQGPDGAAIEWPIVPDAGRAGARLPVDPKDTLWSLIRRVVEAQGFVVFVDLDRLVVSTSRTLGADGELRADADRVHVVFGRELESLRMKRTLTNRTRPVVLRQYDPTTGDTIATSWPRDENRTRPSRSRRGRTAVVTRRTGGAVVTHDDASSAEEFIVTGTRSGDELDRLAESVFRRRALQELEGSFRTHDPVLPQVRGVRGRPAPDFDVWSIHTATTLFADVGAEADVAFDTTAPRAARERSLVAKGYAPDVAAALVTSWSALGALSLPFIVRKATLSLDAEQGFTAEVDFQTMLTPQVEGEVGAPTAAPSTTPAPATLTRGR